MGRGQGEKGEGGPPGSSNDSDNFAIGHMCHNDVPQIITFHPQEGNQATDALITPFYG